MEVTLCFLTDEERAHLAHWAIWYIESCEIQDREERENGMASNETYARKNKCLETLHKYYELSELRAALVGSPKKKVGV